MSRRETSAFSARARTPRQLNIFLGKDGAEIIAQVVRVNCEILDAKMQALLSIAEKVRRDGREVTEKDVAAARAAGADDQAIHDTILITATFCLFNKYVDGLGTWTPDDPLVYEKSGTFRAAHGYGTLIK